MYWRNMRKVMVYEIMSSKNMEASLSLRRNGVRKTIKHVYESMGTGVNIADIAFSTSLSVVTSLVLGKSLDQDEQNHNLGEDRLQDVITRLIDLLGAQKISGFLPILARLDLQGVQEKINCEFHKFDEILQRIIDDRLSVKSKESTENHGRKDFLQILLELRQQNSSSSYSIPQIKALLVVVFVVGTDTSASMVEWAMAELLKYPEVMKKTREELEQVIGLDTIVEESHLPKLRYLDAVIKEALRFHPPLPFLIRQSPNESCKVGEYTIPKGLPIYLNIWAIQRDPQYWENPSEFNPKRFLNPDEYVNKFKYNGSNTNYLPFGSGRRICPGIPMGVKMFMYLLASLVHSFHWTLSDPKELELSDEFGVLLKKQNPLVAIPSQRLANKHLYM